MGEGTPSSSGPGLQCSWGRYTAGEVAGCLMRPQYEVPLTCWKRGDFGADESRALQRAVRKDEELGDWKDFCPLHAAAVSYVLMAGHGDVFGRLYKEAGQDPGVEAVLTKVDAQGRLLEGFSVEPKELVHSTDSGQAAPLLPQLLIHEMQRVG